MPLFAPLSKADPAAIEMLLDEAFGADRHLRTAYRLRAGTLPVADLSLAAFEDGRLVGTLQSWPIELICDEGGAAVPLLLIGPVAVLPTEQSHGIGKAMMAEMLARADAVGAPPQMLIGDPGYYERFGFFAEPTAGWRLPGPVERHRLLVRIIDGRALPANGMLRARITANA